MKQKLEKAKTFVKKHKKEIAIGVGTAVIGGVVYMITKKKPKINSIDSFMPIPYKDLEIPKLDIGRIDELWQDKISKMAIVNDFTIADMGDIGQEFLKIDGVTNETEVSVIMSLVDTQKS